MSRTEEIHKLIYTNLSLLKAGGHNIEFKQDMFKERNLPGFEAVGYGLLMIIDPQECKSKIPWPLVNDKAQSREFRTNFTKFIKMINTRYKDAKIPEINPSSLQFPGGPKFLDFIYKLSTFALELELKKILSPEERENLLPKPLLRKSKDQKVKLTIVRGALREEEETLLQFKEYEANGPSMLMKTIDCLNQITTNCERVKEKLELEVSSLDLDDKTKESLLNVEDCTAITDYNERIERKCEEIENNSHKLCQIHDLAVQCCQPAELSQQYSQETVCLDGHKLGFNRFLNELAGGPVVNLEGAMKLVEVVRAAHTAVTRLTRSAGSNPLLLPVQDLQVRCSSAATKANKVESVLKCLLQENKQAVDTLRPLVYSTLKKKEMPDVIEYLQERPPLNFVLPKSAPKIETKRERRRKSFGTVIGLHKKRNTVVCSFKTKREYKKHVSSTPIFKTPACRKSLYATLPSGRRHKHIEEDKLREDPSDDPTPLSSVLSTNQESTISEPSPSLSCSTNKTNSPHPTLAPRGGRKSLNDIVQRYLKLKETMNMSSNSKNESDACNESET